MNIHRCPVPAPLLADCKSTDRPDQMKQSTRHSALKPGSCPGSRRRLCPPCQGFFGARYLYVTVRDSFCIPRAIINGLAIGSERLSLRVQSLRAMEHQVPQNSQHLRLRACVSDFKDRHRGTIPYAISSQSIQGRAVTWGVTRNRRAAVDGGDVRTPSTLDELRSINRGNPNTTFSH